MNAPDPVVHESETQRQYVRARLPCEIEIVLPDGPRRFKLKDVSAGGLSFDPAGESFSPNQRFAGQLHFSINTVKLTVPVQFHVRHADRDTGLVGVRFDELDPDAIATLRRVIGSYLGGELVDTGAVLSTLARNNFGGARGSAKAPPPSSFSRGRALAQTLLVVLVGAAALAYTVRNFDDKVFGTRSVAAQISGPGFAVEMPRDGVFTSLVPADGRVAKGAAIATFETEMLKVADIEALKARLTPDEIAGLLGTAVKGTITSPCDCQVTGTLVSNGQFVGKGRRIIELSPLQFEPVVLARFHYGESDRLKPGTAVKVDINGESRDLRGEVVQVRNDTGGRLGEDVIVTVRPESPLPMALINRPAEVSLAGSSWLAAQLFGSGTARAEDAR